MDRKKNSTGKYILRAVFALLVLAVVIAGGYCIYVIATYHRIEDNVELEICSAQQERGTEDNSMPVTGEVYSVLTYNIGFCAYLPDFSFFMDGGKSSRCKSEESAAQTADDIGSLLEKLSPDIVILEEVDIDSTRSWHVNQLEIIKSRLKGYDYNFAMNYNSAYIMLPIYEPHGSSKAGIVTASAFPIESAIRRSFPIADSFNKYIDMDRCFSVSYIPVENGKYLCIFSVHMSAYGTNDAVRFGQTNMLIEAMKEEYEKGNYIICGGDYNHNLRLKESQVGEEFDSWAYPFSRDMLPDYLTLTVDFLSEKELAGMPDTCRDAGSAYIPGETETYMLDGFIISDNIEMISLSVPAVEFEYSDHNPVLMEFKLK